MLRWTLALLLVANLLFLAWSRNGLAPLGLGPVSESEPQRLQQQVRPEVIVLRPARPDEAPALPPPDEAASAVAVDAASAPAPADGETPAPADEGALAPAR